MSINLSILKKVTLIDMYNKYEPNFFAHNIIIEKKTTDELKKFLEFTASNPICKKYTFSNEFFNSIFREAEIDIAEFELLISKNSFKNTWEVINDKINVLLLLLLRFYKKGGNTKMYKIITNLTLYKLYSNLLGKYFQLGCQDSVMNYTISSLSNYFLLGQYEGNILDVLHHTLASSDEKYSNNLLSENEKEFADYLLNLRTRINQSIQYLAKEYYKVYEEKLYLNAHKVVVDEEGIEVSGLFGNDTQHLIKIKNTVNNYIINIGLDMNVINSVNRITEVKAETIKVMFEKILKDRHNCEKLVDSIFDSLGKMDSICSKNFILNSLQFLASKYDDNKFKPEVERILNQEIGEYRKLNTANSKSRFRRALAILFLVYLQKSNCNN